MSYTSSTFIFLVLSGLMVAAFLPLRLRIFWMIALSLGWFATWDVYLPVVLVVLILIHYLCGKNNLVWPAVLVTISAFAFFRLLDSSLAVGCSFYLLILLGYTIDVSNRKSPLLNLEESLLMGTFFPLMMSGPVVRSDSFSSSIREDRMSWEYFFDGSLIFATGFLKFVLFNEFFTNLAGYYNYNQSWVGIILSSLFVTFQLYLSLSSFADMGRGIARAFGIVVTPSFVPVVFARDPSDFWERWNRTVAGWFRDYLVFPSLLKWGRKVPAGIIIFLTFIVLGIWHGFAAKWVLFGVFNGLMVILGSALRRKFGYLFAGRLLVFILLVGNGFIHIIRDVAATDPGNLLSGFNELVEVGPLFYAALLVYFIFEWMQERRKDNDFFLYWHPVVKKVIAIGLFILWIFLAEHREPIDPETLPLYFNL